MRQLIIQEIKELASRKEVRKLTVENFLMSMGEEYVNAILNARVDAEAYHWNLPTYLAILDGIKLANEEVKSEQ